MPAITLSLFLGLLVSSAFANSKPVLLSQSGTALRYGFDFTSVARDGSAGMGVHQVPGMPEVPVVTATILLPPGRSLKSARFEPHARSERRVRQTFATTPAPTPLCDCSWRFTDMPRPFRPGEVYPAAVLGSAREEGLRGHRIAMVSLHPWRALPADGEAIGVDGGELVLEMVPEAPGALYRGTAADREAVRQIVDNPELLAAYPAAARAAASDYPVIAPKSYFDDTDEMSLQTLLDEKKSRGLVVLPRTLEDVTSTEKGRHLQEKVRNAIIRHYKDDGVRFVLLVGNGYSVLPTRKLKVNMSEGTIYSDFYFACLDGDFDANKNGIFGETKDGPGGKDVDLTCDVAVGRAPVSNLEDMHAFVQKTIAFASVTFFDPRIWNNLLFGEKLDESTLGGKTIDQLATGGKAGALQTQGYPDAAKHNKAYETFSKAFKADEVISLLNGGDFYTVNHLGHANETYCMRFQANKISELENALPFFGITQGCHPGNLKAANWASKMVVHPNGGAAAMIANSNYGFYYQGKTDGPSNRFHLAFYDTVFRDQERNLGIIHFKAKTKLIPDVTSSSVMRWVVYETNLLGDPELELRF